MTFTDNNTTVVKEVNIPFSTVDTLSRRKINENGDWNNNIEQ